MMKGVLPSVFNGLKIFFLCQTPAIFIKCVSHTSFSHFRFPGIPVPLVSGLQSLLSVIHSSVPGVSKDDQIHSG